MSGLSWWSRRYADRICFRIGKEKERQEWWEWLWEWYPCSNDSAGYHIIPTHSLYTCDVSFNFRVGATYVHIYTHVIQSYVTLLRILAHTRRPTRTHTPFILLHTESARTYFSAYSIRGHRQLRVSLPPPKKTHEKHIPGCVVFMFECVYVHILRWLSECSGRVCSTSYDYMHISVPVLIISKRRCLSNHT